MTGFERAVTRKSARLAAMVLALMAPPALADVKAGVDAWSAGDFTRAVKEWQAGADKGDPDAQFNLGQAYRLGKGIPEDTRKAEYYYSKAAAQGHMQAADNYGLILFQDGRRDVALPYIKAAAERGDPRAQYLLGIAYFNGDLVAKDWVRAYALVSLSNSAGLPQAAAALGQMDQYIPLEQRQAAASLATQLQQQSDATRARQLASADLGASRIPRPIPNASVAASSASPSPAGALPPTGRVAGDSPATAGADYARPAVPTVAPAAKPAPKLLAPVAARPVATAAGGWRVQLGAFSVRANADRLWSQIGGKGPLAGKSKVTEPAGSLTKLYAAGFSSNAEANSVCAALKQGGHSCLVSR